MDAIKYLKEEHSRFRKQLKQINALKDEDAKLKKFDEFCVDLKNHEKMEQKAWYPVLKKDKDLDKIIKHLLAEEKSAADAMKRFKKTGFSLIWKLRFYKFSHDVDHHAREEEKTLFPRVREKFSKAELSALGVKMRKYKASLSK